MMQKTKRMPMIDTNLEGIEVPEKFRRLMIAAAKGHGRAGRLVRGER